MHHHCEIIMPPSANIQETIDAIMKPFSENDTDDEGHSGHAFWDWFVIGGRWAGTKETCRYDAGKMEEFYKRLAAERVTVSGFQCGKQQLEPASQIPIVDGIWNEFFPTETGEITPCPVFAHSNNQYDSNDLLSCDICRVDEISESLTAGRVIIAGPNYDDSRIEAHFMLCDDQWNGVNHMKVDWDGKVLSALTQFTEKASHYREEYAAKITPKPEWICVTVDYHS
jgi:hypothetical protein